MQGMPDPQRDQQGLLDYKEVVGSDTGMWDANHQIPVGHAGNA